MNTERGGFITWDSLRHGGGKSLCPPAGLGTGGSHSARPSLRQENAHIQLSGQAESRPRSSPSLFSSSLEGLDGAPTLMRETFFIQSANLDAHLLQGDP